LLSELREKHNFRGNEANKENKKVKIVGGLLEHARTQVMEQSTD